MARIFRKTSGKLLEEPNVTASLSKFGVRPPIAEQAHGIVREVEVPLEKLVTAVNGIVRDEDVWDRGWIQHVLGNRELRILGSFVGNEFHPDYYVENDPETISRKVKELESQTRDREIVLLKDDDDRFRRALRIAIVRTLMDFTERLNEHDKRIDRLIYLIDEWKDIIVRAPEITGEGRRLQDVVKEKLGALIKFATESDFERFERIWPRDGSETGPLINELRRIIDKEKGRRQRIFATALPTVDTGILAQGRQRFRLAAAALLSIFSIAIVLLSIAQVYITHKVNHGPKHGKHKISHSVVKPKAGIIDVEKLTPASRKIYQELQESKEPKARHVLKHLEGLVAEDLKHGTNEVVIYGYVESMLGYASRFKVKHGTWPGKKELGE